MGSLDLLSQAILCIKHTVNQLIKHNHTQLSDMNKTFMVNQNEMAEGKTTLHEKIRFSGNVFGLPRGKNVLIKPSVKWGKCPSVNNSISETSMGFTDC